MNQSEEQRSTEPKRCITIKGDSTEMLRLVCIKVIDPKNIDKMEEYVILRVPKYALEGIIANYGDRVSYTSKGAYKHFVNEIRKQNNKFSANSVGTTSREIRYAGIMKKEELRGTNHINGTGLRLAMREPMFPAYKDDYTHALTSDLKEEERKEKIRKGILGINNCRKKTRSRRRTPKGNFTPSGLPIGKVNAYDIIRKVYADRGLPLPADILRDIKKEQDRLNP